MLMEPVNILVLPGIQILQFSIFLGHVASALIFPLVHFSMTVGKAECASILVGYRKRVATFCLCVEEEGEGVAVATAVG